MPPAQSHRAGPGPLLRACRKAAHDARRARKPAAFETRVVVHETVLEHGLDDCVARVLASTAACRKGRHGLAQLSIDGPCGRSPGGTRCSPPRPG